MVELTQNFFDNLVLTSEQTHLDTIGFEFSLIDDVDRFLELLCLLACRATLLKDHPKEHFEPPPAATREQLATCLAHLVLEAIRRRALERDSTQTDLQQ